MKAIAMNIQRITLEDEQKWMDEIDKIPYLQFPPDWQIQMIPPFGDAVVRFRVKLPSGNKKSVYLDSRSSLGCCWGDDGEPVPYWEVYPHQNDVGRCDRSDTATLLMMIADETDGDSL